MEDIQTLTTIAEIGGGIGASSILGFVAYKLYQVLVITQDRLESRYQDLGGINRRLDELIEKNVETNTSLKEAIKYQTETLKSMQIDLKK